MKKKINFKKKLPNILIGVGIVMVFVFIVYEGASYPWRLLFSQWGLAEIGEELPDPKPLPQSAQTPGVPALPAPVEDGRPMPAQPGWLTVRPVMDITSLGWIKIPKIQLSENLIEGSGDELFYGVGHVRGTAMPGEKGNCVLGGHRNYIIMRPFRYLDRMAAGDQIHIAVGEERYTYTVFKIFEIEPDESWILNEQEEEEYLLTLLTCTPVIGLNRRLIVWAKME